MRPDVALRSVVKDELVLGDECGAVVARGGNDQSTSSTPALAMNSAAFSQRMPPVQ